MLQFFGGITKQDTGCQRLLEVPGIGPVVSSALCCWMGDGRQFSRGRDAAAALGLIPKQHSSGGKQVLLGITKRGNGHVRAQVVHGARNAFYTARKAGLCRPLLVALMVRDAAQPPSTLPLVVDKRLRVER